MTGRCDGHGNFYRYRGAVHLATGRTVPIWDVFLATAPGTGGGPEPDDTAVPLDGNASSLVSSAHETWTTDVVPDDDDAVAVEPVTPAPVIPDVTPTPLQVVEYYHLDAIGSVRAVTDAQGQVLARHDFQPFGVEVAPQSPPRDRRLFTGQQRDFETGLDYLHARQLRPDLGRFSVRVPRLPAPPPVPVSRV